MSSCTIPFSHRGLEKTLSPQRCRVDYDDARQKYADAMHTLGYQADLAYNTALCYFKDKQYGPALKHAGELVVTSSIC